MENFLELGHYGDGLHDVEKKNHQIVYLEVIGFKVYELYLKNKNVNSRHQGSQEALSGMAFGVESRWRG